MLMEEGAWVENWHGPNRTHVPFTTSELKNPQSQDTASATGEIIHVTRSTVQDLGSLQLPLTTETSTDTAFTTFSSQNPYKEKAVGHKITPGVENGSAETEYKIPFTDPNQ